MPTVAIMTLEGPPRCLAIAIMSPAMAELEGGELVPMAVISPAQAREIATDLKDWADIVEHNLDRVDT